MEADSLSSAVVEVKISEIRSLRGGAMCKFEPKQVISL